MAKKRMNPWLAVIVVLLIPVFLLALCSDDQPDYSPVTEMPRYRENSQPQDGDTQADTIKALQAYAKAAVNKAEHLHEYTQAQANQVVKNSSQLDTLQRSQQVVDEKLQQSLDNTRELHTEITALKKTLLNLQRELARQQPAELNNPQTDKDIELPLGLGFEEVRLTPDPNQGQWYPPIDRVSDLENTEHTDSFSGLLDHSSRLDHRLSRLKTTSQKTKTAASAAGRTAKAENTPVPAFTLPKDAILTDAVALTALIGRIPVNGQTPDPYPIKLLVGRDNLLANDHQLPEVEGMIFSGLGVGDVNLSCVSARLYSASFIFADGRIVNQTSRDKPLGYLSDPYGFPCIAGRFVTNAPQFIATRMGLAGLGTAGAAYAAAQQETATASLTGTTTSAVVGSIDKLVAGEMVQSATDEVTQWLLERQKQSFDAVVVDPGAGVAVHLDQAILIDYQPQGRQVRYDRANLHDNRTMD